LFKTVSFLRNERRIVEDCEAFNREEITAQIASSDTHEIIVSYVKNACDIHFQLAINSSGLEEVMNKLEEKYYYYESSTYTIPIEFIKNGLLCSGVYVDGKDWHRCVVVHNYPKDKCVEAYFIGKTLKFFKQRIINMLRKS
jgi:hypothetical protein